MTSPELKVFYSDHFEIPLPTGHRFPIAKYRMLRERLLENGLLVPSELAEAPLAGRETLLQAHDPDYIDRFLEGRLSEAEVRRIGFPWSSHLVKKALASVGGAMAAAEAALRFGISGNLAGGVPITPTTVGDPATAYSTNSQSQRLTFWPAAR